MPTDIVRLVDCDTRPIACELQRVADAMTGFDWNGFASTLLATLIGAFVAAAVALWVNNRERPQPMWRVEVERPSGQWHIDAEGMAGIAVRATNIGDGTAYNVDLTFVGVPRSAWFDSVALIEPGASLRTVMRVPASGDTEYDVHTGERIDTRAVEWPSHPRLIVTWQQPPRRQHVRRYTAPLGNPFARVRGFVPDS